MTYSEAIHNLYQLRLFGAKLGLRNSEKLAGLLGHPEKDLRFVHVAGTNGKGSTCVMLEALLRAGGHRVGLYTSPHLVSFRERIQVDRQSISEQDVVRLLESMQSSLGQFPPESSPTFFEVVTLMALLYFAEKKCDVVVWETGLGGRLDATNIVTPWVSVITNIHADHQKWLGSSLEDIAREKAGIIKPGVPVVIGEQKPEPLRVILETARQQQAPMVRVGKEDTRRPPLHQLKLPLLGDHQQVNAALAVAAMRHCPERFHLPDETIRSSLMRVQWPGRMQIIRQGVGRTLILDGAHNPSCAEALRAATQKLFPGTLPTLIFGVMEDKDWPAMCEVLVPMAGRVLLTGVQTARAADPQTLAPTCQSLNPYAEVTVCGSVSEALELAAYDPLVLLTGSLYLVGEAMELLKLSTASPVDERGLNDWTARPSEARGGGP